MLNLENIFFFSLISELSAWAFVSKAWASKGSAKLILFFYDKDQDGLLSYDEFLDLIQSKKESDYKKVKKFLIKILT